MSEHIGRFANDAELNKARRISLRDDADTDDLIWLTSVVPAMVEEIRSLRQAALTADELSALAWFASKFWTFCGPNVMNGPWAAEKRRAFEAIDKLLAAGKG